jgi:hypothetical protein
MSQVGEVWSSQVQQGTQAAQRAVREQVGKVEHAFAEAARFESRGVSQAKEGIDEMARLAKETIDYWTRLATAWRSLAMDSIGQGAEMFGSTAVASEGTHVAAAAPAAAEKPSP